jgi:hypothetical protein
MIQKSFSSGLLVGFLLLLLASPVVYAQATRTWVSGVGDDVNPCSRTAPCKTFAGAISKTAAGGEINALDPAGYGAVTIVKAITINGGGTFASILASGANGVIVNAGPNDKVTLRNLSINGAGTGLNGIRFIAGGALHVENCDIFGFAGGTALGLDFEPGGSSRLSVFDTVIRENGTAAVGGGVLIKPGGGTVKATLDKVRLINNLFGIRAEGIAAVTVRDSIASGNTRNGFLAASTGSAVQLNVENSAAVNNGTNGVATSGAAATVVISNVTIMNNSQGINPDGGGNILSFGNNMIIGNLTNGIPTGTVDPQ